MKRFPYMHNTGCGKVAFYLEAETRPPIGAVLPLKNVMMTDGSKPVTPMVCGSCGAPLPEVNLE